MEELSRDFSDVLLIPYGAFRAFDGRPKGLASWIMEKDNARAVIQAASARKNDFVIDYEHQTLESAKNGQPAPAAGWFKRLEWREGKGLFALDVQWTPRAQAHIINKEYRYLSPVFTFDRTGNVTSILSAGLTNAPAIDTMPALVAPALVAARALEKGGSSYEMRHAERVLMSAFGHIKGYRPFS